MVLFICAMFGWIPSLDLDSTRLVSPDMHERAKCVDALVDDSCWCRTCRTLSATVALCVVSGLLYIYVVCSSLELNYDWNGWPERAFIACWYLMGAAWSWIVFVLAVDPYAYLEVLNTHSTFFLQFGLALIRGFAELSVVVIV